MLVLIKVQRITKSVPFGEENSEQATFMQLSGFASNLSVESYHDTVHGFTSAAFQLLTRNDNN